MDAGFYYCRAVKTRHKGFSIYIRKFDEVLARRVISCYEWFSNGSWW